MFFGDARPSGSRTAFSMKSRGYEARVFSRPAVVVEVDQPRDRIEHHVLEDRPEAARRRPDLRLGRGGKSDDLRVAAVLEVEDPLVAPPRLVVADQAPVRVRRERRLPGPGKAEEERGGPVLPDVRRAVHRHDPLEREEVVQDREDRLLDLPRVAGVPDEADPAGEVEDDEGLRGCLVDGREGLEAGDAEDRELRDVAPVFVVRSGASGTCSGRRGDATPAR